MKKIIINKVKYSLRVVLSTAFVFLDNFYIFLKEIDTENIEVQVDSKNNSQNLEEFEEEFKDELKNAKLRQDVFENNRQNREVMIYTALYAKDDDTKSDIKKNGN